MSVMCIPIHSSTTDSGICECSDKTSGISPVSAHGKARCMTRGTGSRESQLLRTRSTGSTPGLATSCLRGMRTELSRRLSGGRLCTGGTYERVRGRRHSPWGNVRTSDGNRGASNSLISRRTLTPRTRHATSYTGRNTANERVEQSIFLSHDHRWCPGQMRCQHTTPERQRGLSTCVPSPGRSTASLRVSHLEALYSYYTDYPTVLRVAPCRRRSSILQHTYV